MSLRARRRESACGVARALLRNTMRHSGEGCFAKAIALKPVASSSNTDMWSQSTWGGVRWRYQNVPWQYPPMPGDSESVAASA
eukprot:5133532-Pleurochrysis_carterae.AAC.1